MHTSIIGKFGKVYLADDESLNIIGNCDVHIKIINGYQWNLQDVKFVPSLKRNLISLGQFDSSRYITIFRDSSWKIVKGAMVLA